MGIVSVSWMVSHTLMQPSQSPEARSVPIGAECKAHNGCVHPERADLLTAFSVPHNQIRYDTRRRRETFSIRTERRECR